jgi:ABC-2 type transport system permease protein
LEPGLSAYQGEVLRLEAHQQNESLFRRIEDTLALQRFGALTPGFIMQMLLPLLIVLSGFHLISGERESGTLKQLLASGVSGRKLVLAKILSLFLFALALLLPLFVYLLFDLWINESTSGSRSALFMLSYLAYAGIWVLLTVVVSIYSANSRSALVSLLVIWVACCLILPKLIMVQAQTQYPLTSAREFQIRLESEVYTEQRLQAIAAYKQKMLTQYQVSSIDELPFSWSGAQLQFGENYANNAREHLYQQRKLQLQQQGVFYQFSALLSPFVAVQSLSMGSAASDNIHHQYFIEAAEQYRQTMQKTLNEDLMNNGKSTDKGYLANQNLWQEIKPFSFQYPSLSQVLSHYQPAIYSLLFWAGLLIMVSVMSMRKLTQETR